MSLKAKQSCCCLNIVGPWTISFFLSIIVTENVFGYSFVVKADDVQWYILHYTEISCVNCVGLTLNSRRCYCVATFTIPTTCC